MTAAVLLIGMPASFAQINPFWTTRLSNGLSNADVDMLFAATQHVNTTNPIRVGYAETWSNPDSGNSGKITVTRLFRSGGLACHALRYDLSYKAQRPPRTYALDWCKTTAGEWKIKS